MIMAEISVTKLQVCKTMRCKSAKQCAGSNVQNRLKICYTCPVENMQEGYHA